jgi:hypothetical protein
MVISIAAAVRNVSNDGFADGLLIGVLVGFLAAPILRSLVVRREWRRASREAQLTDELLDRMDRDAGSAEVTGPAPTRPRGPSWQAFH